MEQLMQAYMQTHSVGGVLSHFPISCFSGFTDRKDVLTITQPGHPSEGPVHGCACRKVARTATSLTRWFSKPLPA